MFRVLCVARYSTDKDVSWGKGGGKWLKWSKIAGFRREEEGERWSF